MITKNLNFWNTSSILLIYEGDSTVAIVLYVCCGRVSLAITCIPLFCGRIYVSVEWIVPLNASRFERKCL